MDRWMMERWMNGRIDDLMDGSIDYLSILPPAVCDIFSMWCIENFLL